jgi:hypothetical protein
MKQPVNSLQAVLERQARGATPTPPAEPSPAAPRAAAEPTSRKFHRPSRDGRRLVAGHFEPRVAKQLKLLAAEEDTTVQDLLAEALDLLFVKKGKGKILGA